MAKPTTAERFWAKVDQSAGPDGCWIWTGARTTAGYGHFTLSKPRRGVYAHRFAYELLVGPIPDGLPLDHLCRNRRCVNPAHLEPVTHRENILRGTSPIPANAVKTHCDQGHEFTPENTYIYSDGGRKCRTCRRLQQRRYVEAKQGRPVIPRGEKTHCPRGHPYDGENLYVVPASGFRQCRTCGRENAQKYRAARQSAGNL